jgi:hypothetical protein
MYVTTTLQGPDHDEVTAASNCSRSGNRGSRETRKTMTADDGEMRRR